MSVGDSEVQRFEPFNCSGQTFYDACQAPCLFCFYARLAHPLSSHVGQVVVFVVRLMVSPHHKNNLKPLGSQSSERSGMTVSFSPLVPIIFVRPLTSIERVKRNPVDRMPEVSYYRQSENVRHDFCHSIWLRGLLPPRPEGDERIASDSWHRPTQPKAWVWWSRFFLPAGSLQAQLPA